MRQISPMLLINLTVLMIQMILSRIIGPLAKTVASTRDPDFYNTGSNPRVPNSS